MNVLPVKTVDAVIAPLVKVLTGLEKVVSDCLKRKEYNDLRVYALDAENIELKRERQKAEKILQALSAITDPQGDDDAGN